MLKFLSAFALMIALSVTTMAQTFNWTSFTGTEPVTLNGNAAFNASDIRVAQNLGAVVGSMFHQTQQPVINGFDTTFSFRMSTNGADGMAFIIHNDPRGDTFLGFNGSSLGYATESGQPAGTGLSNGLVIELDSFTSTFPGSPGDLSNNEISVHTNGLNEMHYGEDQSLGSVSPAANLNDGAIHTLRILYVPGTLDIFLDGATTPTLSVPYDFVTGGTHFFGGNPVGGLNLNNGTAWIGISAACGGVFQDHDLVSWTFTPAATLTDDVGIAAITSPTNNSIDCSLLSSTESVTMEIRNTGMNPIAPGTLMSVSYQVNSNIPVFEIASVGSTLNTGASFTHTFATTVDMSAPGTYNISANVLYGLDLDASNDTLMTSVGSGGQLRISTFPWVEDFTVTGASGTTSPPSGFINETTDATGPNSDWVFRNGLTPTSGTGPAADHTTGVLGTGGYAHIDDDGNFGTVNLRSPCFDLAGLVNPSLRFFMHSRNSAGSATSNLLSVDVITYPGATVTMDVFGPQGQTGTDWAFQAVDLSPFSGQVIQLVFRADSVNSGSNTHDIAIDDVSVTDLLPTPGQAPQPGAAVFELNQCRNANLDLLNFGFGGPYFTTATQGDTLVFDLSGESLSTIIMFAGALNPAAATFPNIGSIDVGGPVDPVTGLPTGLVVIGNGGELGGLNPFFVTTAAGETEIGFTVPALPLGVLGTFQCAFTTTTGPGVALSNAVQLTIF